MSEALRMSEAEVSCMLGVGQCTVYWKKWVLRLFRKWSNESLGLHEHMTNTIYSINTDACFVISGNSNGTLLAMMQYRSTRSCP